MIHLRQSIQIANKPISKPYYFFLSAKSLPTVLSQSISSSPPTPHQKNS